MKYILLIILSNSQGTLGEYNGLEACMKAREQVARTYSIYNDRYKQLALDKTICVEKGVSK